MSVLKKNKNIGDILLLPNCIPIMPPKTLLKEALELMTESRLGIACVVEKKKLIAIFTDGDLRRLLLKSQKPISALFADDIIVHARRRFASIGKNTTLNQAIELLQNREIFDLPVIDDDGHLEGIIHLHPALRELLAS